MVDQKKPECQILSAPGGGFYGIYRITGAWQRVKDGNGMPFANEYQALRAAQKRLHGLLFPDIKVEREDPVDPALQNEVSAFLERREQEKADLGKDVFRQIFTKSKKGSSKAVAVETRKRRAKR